MFYTVHDWIQDYFELGVILLRKKLFTQATKNLEKAKKTWDGEPDELAQVTTACPALNLAALSTVYTYKPSVLTLGATLCSASSGIMQYIRVTKFCHKHSHTFERSGVQCFGLRILQYGEK